MKFRLLNQQILKLKIFIFFEELKEKKVEFPYDFEPMFKQLLWQPVSLLELLKLLSVIQFSLVSLVLP